MATPWGYVRGGRRAANVVFGLLALGSGAHCCASEVFQEKFSVREIYAHGEAPGEMARGMVLREALAFGLEADAAASLATSIGELSTLDAYPFLVLTPGGLVCFALAADVVASDALRFFDGTPDEAAYRLVLAFIAKHEAAHCEALAARNLKLEEDSLHWFEEARADAQAELWAMRQGPEAAAMLYPWHWFRFFGFLKGKTEHWGGAVAAMMVDGGDASLAAAAKLYAALDGAVLDRQVQAGWRLLCKALLDGADGSDRQKAAWAAALEAFPAPLRGAIPPLGEIRRKALRVWADAADWRLKALGRR